MSDKTVECWLVERELGDRDFVTLVYATPDGSRYQQRHRSSTALRTGSEVTAAVDVPEAELERVPDAETRDRYAAEVERTADRYDPDDPI
ncbi:hypothetical protein [Natrinema halophilum]|uniref:DUF7967 domain-containing protein n=1 Tax=Natrinema halophilum TaxID=1699371 RepID=A0A7D5GL70_9EURY|nr:hypothetical protein [Natrinema halophilum]QLG49630.1 hypothetical protein HYG82_12545 [Natrinema halophilum]